MRYAAKILGQAIVLTLVASAIGFVFNLARPSSLDWVARSPYDIYKDCPELSKEAAEVKVEHLEEDLSSFVILDARPTTEFLEAHIPAARSVPFDPIRPMEDSLVEELKKAGPNRILVYGDVAIDSGRLMAGELASAGLLGVRFLAGGFEAWRKAGKQTESGGEQ